MRRWARLALVVGSCQAEPVELEPLEAWFSGCDDVGGACAVEVGDPAPSVAVWTEAPGPFQVTLEGRAAPVTTESVDGGTRLTVAVLEVPTRLRVATDTASFELPVVAAVPRRVVGFDTCGPGASAEDRPEGAIELAQDAFMCAWAAASSAEGEELVQATAARDRALAAYVSSLRQAGLVTEQAEQQAVAVHLARVAGRTDAARSELESFPPTRDADIAWLEAYYASLLALDEQDLRGAQESLDEARTWLRRLPDPDNAVATDSHQANLAGTLGDVDGALDAMRRLGERYPIDSEACDPYSRDLAENIAWHEMIRVRSGRARTPGVDPAALLAQVQEAADRCSAAPIDRTWTAVNRAFEAWSRGDYDAVSDVLRGRDVRVNPELGAWGQALLAVAALDAGALTEARQLADEALLAARSGASPDAELFAWTVLADVELAAGRPAEAEQALVEAHEALWSRLPDVPSGTDRGRFVGARHGITLRLVQMLLADDRADDALALLRTARGRALRSLREGRTIEGLAEAPAARWAEAQAAYLAVRKVQAEAYSTRWTLSGAELAEADVQAAALRRQAAQALDDALAVVGRADADDTLRTPEPGEALVAWVPLGERWAGLVSRGEQVDVAWGPGTNTPIVALPDALAASLGDRLDEVERLTVLPWGIVHHLDMHAARVDGRPLVADLEVVYSVDLPPRAAREPGAGGVLVVSDGREDLPHARREAAAVASETGGTHLTGSAATRDAVLPALAAADRLHFSGHGLLDPDQVWRSGLALADGDLELGDVLAVRWAPRHVVLSGCETGRSPDDAQVAALGIAQAFVMAGSEQVVAATRQVDDADAAQMALAVSSGDPQSLVRSLVAAQRERLGEPADWSAWRVWVR